MEFDLITNMDCERQFEATTGADSCLIIIGNGFDLHHGLATKYLDYRNWLKTMMHEWQLTSNHLSMRWIVSVV